MKNKKNLLIFVILLILGIVLIISGIIIPDKKIEKPKKENNKDQTSELVPLNTTTNDLLVFIEDGVNEELIGTYAFIESFSYYDNSRLISAVKKDGNEVEILNIDIEEIETYFYHEGKIYIESSNDTFYIDLTKGNGNYSLEKLSKDMKDAPYTSELIESIDKGFEKDDNSCIKINNVDDFVCEIYYDNESEYIMHYLSANVSGKESWKLQEEDKSFYYVGILSDNKLLIEIHQNGNTVSDNDVAIVDLSTGKILEDETIDINIKSPFNLYYIG